MATTTAAPAPDPNDRNRELKKRALLSPARHYVSHGGAWHMAGTGVLDGAPTFTYLDIPRMFRAEPTVIFAAQMWRSPFQKAEFTVKAGGTGSDETDAKLGAFVQTTIKRFFRTSLPRLLSRYFKYGFCAGAAEFEARDGWLRLSRVRAIEPADARPRVFADGPKKNRFAGFTLSNAGDGETFVGWPHAFWFAGHQEFGEYYDRPPLMGMFEPFLEKNGRNGAKHLRRIWFRKNAGRGAKLYYPPGQSNVGTDENPQTVDNQDLARQLLDYGDSTSTYVFENTLNAGNPQMREWEMEEAEATADIAGFLDYPDKLDQDMIKGCGIPLEVIQGSDSGSGYKGRLVSYGGFLGVVDEYIGLIIEACDSWLAPLVRMNYGELAWYEVEPISLATIAAEEEKRNPSGSSAIGAPLPGLPGDGSKAGGEQDASPLQLSTLAPAPAPLDPKALIEAVAGATASAVAAVLAAARPAPVELSAVVGPDSASPEAKKDALNRTQQKLMRSRKSTIAQLLALAMVKKQQEATAAGDPQAAAGSLSQLSILAGDPMQVARIIGLDVDKGKELSAADWTELELAWTRVATNRGEYGFKAVNSETGKVLYGKAAAAALEREGRGGQSERQFTREQAKKTATAILSKAATGSASAEDLQTFAQTLPNMRGKDLLGLRQVLQFNLRGERKKAWMVERILDHVDQQVGAKTAKRAPDESRVRKPGKWDGTVTGLVSDFGGLDPDSAALKRHYGSWREAVADGVPLAAFRARDGGRGRRSLDQLAQELGEKNVRVPEGADPEEHLLAMLKRGTAGKVSGSEDDFEQAWEEYQKQQAEAEGEQPAEQPPEPTDAEIAAWNDGDGKAAEPESRSAAGLETPKAEPAPEPKGEGGIAYKAPTGLQVKFQDTKDDSGSYSDKATKERIRGLGLDPENPDHIATLSAAANAGDGGSVHFLPDDRKGRLIVSTHKDSDQLGKDEYSAKRTFYLSRGKLVVDNDSFFNRKGAKRQGADVLANQVAALQKMGVAEIRTSAQRAGGMGGMNGYYTWPRLGYDGYIPKKAWDKMPDAMKRAVKRGSVRSIFALTEVPLSPSDAAETRTILSEMDTQRGIAPKTRDKISGADWWMAHGDTFKATFDLGDGSKSVKALTQYLAERNSKKEGVSGTEEPGRGGTGVGVVATGTESRAAAGAEGAAGEDSKTPVAVGAVGGGGDGSGRERRPAVAAPQPTEPAPATPPAAPAPGKGAQLRAAARKGGGARPAARPAELEVEATPARPADPEPAPEPAPAPAPVKEKGTGKAKAEPETVEELMATEKDADLTPEEQARVPARRYAEVLDSIREHLRRGADPEEQAKKSDGGRVVKRSLLDKKRAAYQAVADMTVDADGAPVTDAAREERFAQVDALLPDVKVERPKPAAQTPEEPEVRETPEPVDEAKAAADRVLAARAALDAVKRAPGAKDTRKYKDALKAAQDEVSAAEAAEKAVKAGAGDSAAPGKPTSSQAARERLALLKSRRSRLVNLTPKERAKLTVERDVPVPTVEEINAAAADVKRLEKAELDKRLADRRAARGAPAPAPAPAPTPAPKKSRSAAGLAPKKAKGKKKA